MTEGKSSSDKAKGSHGFGKDKGKATPSVFEPGSLEFQYKCNSKDMADKYLRTTEAIAAYVSLTYSKHIRDLVLYGKEKEWEEPKAPEGKVSNVVLTKYKIELDRFYDE